MLCAAMITAGKTLLLCLLASLAGCRYPATRPGLRFEPTDPSGFTAAADGRLRAGCGPTILWLDLSRREATIELTVENPGSQPVEVRVGAVGANSTAAIGEVLVRPLGPGNREGAKSAVPYLAHQAFALPNACSATFYLDKPLGIDVDIGQFMVFRIDVNDPKTGTKDQRSIQLVATNTGSDAARGR